MSRREMSEEEQLSVFISLVLRHKPHAAGVTADKYGFVDVAKLIDGINKTGRTIDMKLLEKIVSEDNKKRYSFNPCKSKIRANQGHSFPVIVGTPTTPPDILYHGTATRLLNSIMKLGLVCKTKGISEREDVHLSLELETALDVGKRHGEPVIIEVDARQMDKDNIEFRLADNGVWLTGNIPSKYLKIRK